MSRFCALKACPSRHFTSTSEVKRRKYQLPAGCDPNQRMLWEQFVDRGNRTITPEGKMKRIKLCSEHFETNCLTEKGCLKSNAVPTLFSMFSAEAAHKHGLTPQMNTAYLQYINNFALSTEECRAAIVKHVQVQPTQPANCMGNLSHHLHDVIPTPVVIPPNTLHDCEVTMQEQVHPQINAEWIDGDLFLPLDEGFGPRAYEATLVKREADPAPAYINYQVSTGNNLTLLRSHTESTSDASLLNTNNEGAEKVVVTSSSPIPESSKVHRINDITPNAIANSSHSGKTIFNAMTKDHAALKNKLKMLQQKMRQAKKKVEDLKFLLWNLERGPSERTTLINVISPELDDIIWCMMEEKDFDQEVRDVQ